MSSSASEEYEEPEESEEASSEELQLPSSHESSEEEPSPPPRRKRSILPQVEVEPKETPKPRRVELPSPQREESKVPTLPALPTLPSLPAKPTRREVATIQPAEAIALMPRALSETETELAARKELVSYLLGKRPDLSFQVAVIISHMILNKCKYGVTYNSEAELVLSRLMRS
jgi:hypothetical protein